MIEIAWIVFMFLIGFIVSEFLKRIKNNRR